MWMRAISRFRQRQSGRGEVGSMAVELVVLAPVIAVVMLLMVGLGRYAHARQEVNQVASDAARAASLERNTGLSADAARAAARRNLTEAGLRCASLQVSVNVSSYRPGGSVSATVTCTADLGDVAMSGLPGSARFTSRSVVPIETWRQGNPS